MANQSSSLSSDNDSENETDTDNNLTLHKASLPSQSSWGDAFQIASSVQEEDLGTFNFDPPLSSVSEGQEKHGAGNVAGISIIAKEYQSQSQSQSAVAVAVEVNTEESSQSASATKKRKAPEPEPVPVPDGVKSNNVDVSAEDDDGSVSSIEIEKPKKSKKEKKVKKEKEKKAKKKKKSKKEKKVKKEKKAKKQKTEDAPSQPDADAGANVDADADDNADTGMVEESESESTPSSPAASAPLDGDMVEHNGEFVMVLIDKRKKIVYSMDRTEAGDLKPIGKLVDGKVEITAVITPEEPSSDVFPFPTDPDDHCESPLNSYKDIQPILDHLAKSKSKEKLRIYDPYFCNGLVKENLANIGYTNVYNEKEDAYKTWDDSEKSQPYPEHDVFITNPPYSSDHVDRLIKHLTTSPHVAGKPWCLLMPNYVHKKDYYKDILAKKGKNGIQPFYLIPNKRYVYLPPKYFREKKDSDVHKKSSPFVSMWYIWGGTMKMNEKLIHAYQKNGDGNCDLARTPSALRDLRRKGKKR